MEYCNAKALNLTPYFARTTIPRTENCLYGFKGPTACLNKMPLLKVHMTIEPQTGEKFLIINGKKMKVLSQTKMPTGSLVQIDKKPGDKNIAVPGTSGTMPGKARCSMKSGMSTVKQNSVECQTDIPDPLMTTTSETLGCFIHSFLYGGDMSPRPNLGFIGDTGLLRNLDDPKIRFHQDLMGALKMNELGNMPIHEAVLDNNFAKVNRLVVILKILNKSLNFTNSQGYTPLQLAVLNKCQITILQYLLTNDADVTPTDQNGNTVLHLAVEGDDKTVLDLLATHAARIKRIGVDFINYEGCTPLIQAVVLRKVWAAEILLVAGANVNMQDQKSGRCALFHAAENHHVEMVRMLLFHQADTAVRNFFGTSPHDAMFEMDDIPQEIRNLIWASKKRKNKLAPGDPLPAFKVLKMVKTYQKVK